MIILARWALAFVCLADIFVYERMSKVNKTVRPDYQTPPRTRRRCKFTQWFEASLPYLRVQLWIIGRPRLNIVHKCQPFRTCRSH